MPDIPKRAPIADAPISLLLWPTTGEVDIGAMLAAWTRVLGDLQRPYEILLLPLRPETDGQLSLEQLAARFPHTQVVPADAPRGVGLALATGLLQAQHPLLCTAPCDTQFQPEDLLRLLKAIDPVDLVAGYRLYQPVPGWLAALDGLKRVFCRILLGDSPEPRDCWLGWPGWGRRWTARHLFGLRMKDPECPFRLYRREIFPRIPVQSHGVFAQVEILAKANHLGCLLGEVPVTWAPPRGVEEMQTPTFGSEARRLFSNPDFGPTHVPPLSVATTAEANS